MSAFSRLFDSDDRGWSETAPHRTANATDDRAVIFDIGDRAGSPLPRPRSKALRRSFLVLALLGIGGATYQDPSLWPRAWSLLAPAGAWLIEAAQSPPPKAPSSPPAATQTLAPVPDAAPREPVPPPRVAVPPDPAPAPSAEKPPPPTDTRSAAEAARDAAITAMRPPTTDPHQKRAEAVGLHPDLSVALLKRLTDADFKAAASAIRKALADLGDDGALIWPEKPAPTAALFRVSFVQGAAPDCRRYIVAIAKDGWQTTALPVEKCGIRRGTGKRG